MFLGAGGIEREAPYSQIYGLRLVAVSNPWVAQDRGASVKTFSSQRSVSG